MKTNHFSVHSKLLTAAVGCLLSASSLQAQTFAGQGELTTLPMGLEASVYAVTSIPATIKVSFDNRSTGGVRVIIRNEMGHKVYEEFERMTFYRRRFDLSAMPTGTYTIELNKPNEHFSQTFTIEPPTQSYITMGAQPLRKAPELPVDKKLIVSY